MIKAGMLAAICLAMSAELAIAGGDVMEGEKVFQRCLSCHSATDTTNKYGPYLRGIVGRHVAAAEGYYYSMAMAAFGKTGAIWDEARLDKFLKDPSDFVKGTKMKAPPVRRDTERADLIAYLKSHM